MRLYTLKNDKEFVAVQNEKGGFIPIKTLGLKYATMNELIDNITDKELEQIKEMIKKNDCYACEILADKDVRICAPIPVPKQDIVCLGVNYREHIDETKEIIDFSKKSETVYFSKRVNRAIGEGDIIPEYDFVDSLDYEVELGVVLSKDAKNVSAGDAEDYIFGYTIINDISARNVQLKHQQWYLGKSLDGYTAMGPCIVTKDEIKDARALNVFCMVNDEMRQKSNTSYMIQTVAGAIEELTQGMTLKKGTVIATGTPGGVAMGMQPPKYLKSGDKVECRIDKIGTLTNFVGNMEALRH